ncbi:hypothetical protein K445DRAFT_318857 [Daldinia sp. EC12]|nr:hypothetical protein K445DRAFT_318857 [Daldinia sp. EC12]
MTMNPRILRNNSRKVCRTYILPTHIELYDRDDFKAQALFFETFYTHDVVGYLLTVIHTECKNSKQCAPAKHHFDECVERVTNASDDGEAKEDCVEECKDFLRKNPRLSGRWEGYTLGNPRLHAR